jgi:hypothetical protein
MVETLPEEARRQQGPTVQLTWLVAGVTGNKSTLDSWYTGHAVKRERTSQMPTHLERALEVGLKLKKVSDGAFTTMRRLRE